MTGTDADPATRGGPERREAPDRASRRLRVAVFPQPAHFNNPYQPLLHAALERRGASILPPREPSPLRAWGNRDRLDVAHFHWVEPIVRPYPPGRGAAAVAAMRAVRFEAALRALRREAVRIVWTVHNIQPHERRYAWAEQRAMRAMLSAADALIVHSRHAAARVRDELAPAAAEIHVVPHGNYIGAYPEERRDRAAVRDDLGLPADAFVYLAFGKAREYKQLPQAIAAVRAAGDGHLLVAGRPHPTVEPELRRAAGGDPRIHLHLDDVPDEQVAGYHLAADAAILNYRDVFSSGALLLALSFGLPVVAPDRSTATEVAEPPAVEPFRDDLAAALAAVREGDPAARRRAALAAAEACSWDRAAELTLEAYRVR